MEMEHFKEPSFCRLCFNSINDKNFKAIDCVTKDIVEVAQQNLIFEEKEPIMCITCYEKLNEAIDFKTACLYSEDTILPYIDFENPVPVNLKEIYTKEKGINISGDEEICRLCMQPAREDFMSIFEMDLDVFQKYIPEMNINATMDPVICKLCADTLVAHSSFIKNCLGAGIKIKKPDEAVINNPTGTSCLDLHIKCEEDEEEEENKILKTELNLSEFEEKYDEAWIKTEQTEIKSEHNDEECFQSSLLMKEIPETCRPIGNENEIQTESIPIINGSMTGECSSNKVFSNWDAKIEPNGNTNTDITKNSDSLYKCNTCDYKAKLKSRMNQHQIIHKNDSEIHWHKCDMCDYKAKLKNRLTQHQIVHKNSSEIKWHECEVCGHKSKTKNHWKIHQLIHKNHSEIQWYKCNVCDYKAKWKHYFNLHMKIHKTASEIQWYKCDTCDYRTKWKTSLNFHMLVHQDASQIQWYSCDVCEYKTKRKHNLSQHMLTHKDDSEIEWFKCDVCGYKFKDKYVLRRHMLKHREASEIKWFECDICGYKSKRNSDLNRHLLTHRLCETSATNMV